LRFTIEEDEWGVDDNERGAAVLEFSHTGWNMTQSRIMANVMRWVLAVLALLAAAEVAAGYG